MITATEARQKAQLSNETIEKYTLSFETNINKLAEDGKFQMTSQAFSHLSFSTDEFAALNAEQQHTLNIMRKVADKLKGFGFSVDVKIDKKTSEGGFRVDPEDPIRTYKDYYLLIKW